MKKFLFGILLFVILPVISCEAKSSAVFDEAIHDFGKISKDSSVKYTFNFKNTGKSTLVIERIKTSWGCTGTLLSDKEIPAGGSGKLEIELHTDMKIGEIIKTIYVYTNDPDHKMIKLVIKATVLDE